MKNYTNNLNNERGYYYPYIKESVDNMEKQEKARRNKIIMSEFDESIKSNPRLGKIFSNVVDIYINEELEVQVKLKKIKKATANSRINALNFILKLRNKKSKNKIGDAQMIEINEKFINLIEFAIRDNSMKDNLSDSTISHYLRELRCFLNWAYEENYLERKIKLSIKNSTMKNIKPLSAQEMKKMLTLPEDAMSDFYKFRNFVMTCIAYYTALRRESLHCIKLDDIEFLDNGNAVLYVRHMKNKKAYTTHLNKECTDYVKKLYDILLKNKESLDDEYSNNNLFVYLFTDIYGYQLSAHAISDCIGKHTFATVGRRIRSHEIRHNRATNIAKSNKYNQSHLKSLLGDSTDHAVSHYIHMGTEWLMLEENDTKKKDTHNKLEMSS